ncbi:DUF5666 domain-containing protein [Pseudonocardia spinosispora]|uniref:DUF5666 domain-containing protein n=1 Tax=Pseudonocardia spinosispora TaxID=103441 RepID=UPI0003F810F7|nr:DUF5666 domain-containing protein [Pseudonocardia spinosispora]
MSTTEPPKPEEPKNVGEPRTEPEATPEPAATVSPAAPASRRWRPTGRGGLILGGIGVLLVGLVIGGGIGFAAGHHGGGPHRMMMKHHGMGHPGMPGAPGGPEGPGAPGGPEGWGPPGAEEGGGHGWGPGIRFKEGRMGDSGALIGSVASVNGTSVAVTEDGGAPVTVTTTDRTRVFGVQKAAVTDLKQGDRVLVRVGPDKTAIGIRALNASARGTVTALNGTSATVTRPDGLTQTVDTSALTTQPKVGDRVQIEGTPADNGATLKAQTQRILPKSN